MNTCDSDEYAALIDPKLPARPCRSRLAQADRFYRIGPTAMTPVAVSTDPDGSTRVTACLLNEDPSFADPTTNEIRNEGTREMAVAEYVLSELTADEIANLPESVEDPPVFRLRWSELSTSSEDTAVCDTVPCVAQVFVDWKDTYQFARPRSTPETRTRDDMP